MRSFFIFLLCFSSCSFVSLGQGDYKKFLHLSYVELDSLMYIEYSKGAYDKAIPIMQAAQYKAKMEFGEQDSVFAEYTANLAVFYQETEQFHLAESLYLQSMAIEKKVLGELHPYYVNSLNGLAVLYQYMGDYTKAELFGLQALAINKKTLGEQHPEYVTSLNNLANLYHIMGNYPRAKFLLLQSIAISKKILGEQHPNYARSLSYLANVHVSMGNYTKAELVHLQVIEILKKASGKQHPEHSEYATSLNNLAGLYHTMGNYPKAEALLLQSIAIYKKALGEQYFDYASSLDYLANLYTSMGNYTKAELLCLQTIAIQKKNLGEQHPNYARSLNNLALVYTKTGNYTKAEPLYLKTIAIQKKALGEFHPDYAASLKDLANLHIKIKNYSQAEPLYLTVITIQQKALGKFHPDYAASLNDLANLYIKIGNYTQAKPLYLKAIAIQQKVLGGFHPDYAGSLNNLASLYRNMQKLDSAFYFCHLGIIANAPTMDSSFVDWGNLDTFSYISNARINHSIHTLLSILQKQYDHTKDQNKLETHYTISQSAIRLNERIRKGFTSEGDKLRVLAENNEFVLSAIKTGLKLGKADYEATTFGFAEMNKGVLLLEAAKTTNAQEFGGLPDTLADQEKNLQKKQSSLSAKLLEKRPAVEKDSLRRVLNSIYQDIDGFTKMLKNKYPKYVELKYGGKTANVKEIQALLDDKTALLEYVIGDSVVYIFYVDKKQVKLTPIYLSNKILNEKIKALHTTLSDYKLATKEGTVSYQKYTANAFWFYENLVKPSFKAAKGIEKIIIVPDGELGHLPFEAFLTKAAPQKETDYHELNYLSNDYKISYNYSATIWKAAKESVKNKNNGQILAMASNYNIKMDTSTSLSSKIYWRLPYEQHLRDLLNPLPAAHKEIEILKENFNGFFAFDKDASEKNFKSKAEDYAIIHLAMHGLLDDKGPILSSLAFTEDSDSLENNFLHAYEISKMKLNADLVVLSACETGYGRFYKGNGIASLAQAFAYAGAPAMIVSLWQVNDYATSEIMKNLYQNLATGMEKDEALQQAKIDYIQRAEGIAAHPAFWSPFILMGNTDAVYLKTKTNWMWWMIGGILALGGIAVAMRNRRKE